MKIEITREKFLEAVSLAERVSSKQSSLPVLSQIILEANENSLVVRATNLDVGIEVDIPTKVAEKGILALSGGVLKSYLGSIGSKNVVCETDGNILKIKADEGDVSINTSSSEDFPVIPKVSDGKTFSMESKELVLGLKSVLWSASVSTIKPELSSVYVREEGEDLIFVATDSFRLAERKVKIKKPKGMDPILIPFKNTLEIVRTFEGFSGSLEVSASKNQLSITNSSVHISSRLVDGNFPDYRQIIPKEFETEITILKSDFAQALKLSSFFSDTFNQIILSVDPKSKTLSISTKNTSVGESIQKIKGNVDGIAVSMPFNHRYISDCLQSIEGESVVLKFAGNAKPLVINPSSNTSFTYLVMSMNR